MNRKETLTAAMAIVANREKEYGAPEDSFEKIAAMCQKAIDSDIDYIDYE